jgi:hypothetical protein
MDSPAARLTLTVVLPTPPLWFNTEIIAIINSGDYFQVTPHNNIIFGFSQDIFTDFVEIDWFYCRF